MTQVLDLARIINETSLRGSVSQLSAVYTSLTGKVDATQLNELASLIQSVGDAQRKIAVLLADMRKQE